MNPATPTHLPTWLLHSFGRRTLDLILHLYDADGASRVIAFHGPGTEIRNFIRENTHGWTDHQIDNAFLPIVRRAIQVHVDRETPIPTTSTAAR